MKKRVTVLAVERNASIDLTFNGVSALLISDFAEKIVNPTITET